MLIMLTMVGGRIYIRMGMMLVTHLKVLTPEEDEEQLIMRRMRNSVDELRRGYRLLIILISPLTMLVDRWLDYRMQRVKTKAADSKDIREGIELFEEKAS